MPQALDLLTVGEAFDDVIFAGLPRLPRLSEELRVPSLSYHPGGGAIITAIAAARLGLRAGVMTATSQANATVLRRERVAVTNLRGTSEQSAVTVALSTPRDRAFVTYEGVNRVLEPRLLTAMRRLRHPPRHIHFALVPRSCTEWRAVIALASKRGITTSWDFGWHDGLVRDRALTGLLLAVDWVFVNEREALLYSGTSSLTRARRRWRDLAQGTVIKRGADGAIVQSRGREFEKPARKVAVVDTTGAGDSFNGGFLTALLSGATLEDAARLGNYVGGCSVGARGGIDGLPRQRGLPAWGRRLLGGV